MHTPILPHYRAFRTIVVVLLLIGFTAANSTLYVEAAEPEANTTPPATNSVPTPNETVLTALSPNNNETVISRAGLLHVRWKPMPGTHTYGYEAEFNAFGSWTAIGKAQGIARGKNEGNITLDKYFIRQYGSGVDMRWRVWEIKPGNVRGTTSDWALFKYTYGAGKYTFKDTTTTAKRKSKITKPKVQPKHQSAKTSRK